MRAGARHGPPSWRAPVPAVGGPARPAAAAKPRHRALKEIAAIDDLERLITDQIPHLRRYALALLANRDQADDLVQDCLERAWSRGHLWRRGNMRGWLFTIMHNLSVNFRRRQNRMPRMTTLDDTGVMTPVRPAQEDGLAIGALQRALASLPEDQRAVILLVGLEDFSYAETARILGIPIGTVMSRLHRGREQLRRLLSGTAEPPLRRVK